MDCNRLLGYTSHKTFIRSRIEFNMKRIEKGFIGILAIIIIVLAVGIYGGNIKNFFFPSVKSEQNKTANSNPNPATNPITPNEPAEVLNCASPLPANPTEAYTALFMAVKKKETMAIKCQMSKLTLDLAKFMSSTYKKPYEKVLENGMTETTIQPALPKIQNEKINGNQATVEVQKSDGKWDQVPFVKEDGTWKLAFGEVMQGKMSITQPGVTNPTLNTNGPGMIKGNPRENPTLKPVPPLSQPNQKGQK